MRTFVKILFSLAVLAGLAAAAIVWVPGPSLELRQPRSVIGLATPLDVSVRAPAWWFPPAAPAGAIAAATIELEQNGRRFSFFTLPASPETAGAETTVGQEGGDGIRITGTIGKRAIPDLQPGRARLVLTASRRALWGLRHPSSTLVRELGVRLERPRLSVRSFHHYINHGGSEMVVYDVTPADARSGVRVGDVIYAGHPAPGKGATDSLRVAVFALLHDQDLGSPIELWAEDEASNRATGRFDFRAFEKPFLRSRIDLDDRFLERIVPGILEHAPELKVPPPATADELLAAFLKINRDLRRMNTETIASFAAETAPEMLWDGAFLQLGNTQVESRFADHRTYYYKGREVDRQVHLGFDLAATANVPVLAANHGKVLFSDYLGIYGNCVIVDHGLGVQSLYGHMSSIDVSAGDTVRKSQPIGRTGASGLAGGDHLHFTILVDGHPVNPVDWWDPHWIEDRILRKLRALGTGDWEVTATFTPPAAV